jgi:diadenosine tetraphosphate (Ap4A) HIT family hydrolase
MAFAQTMALRSPSLRFSCLAPRIASAVVHSAAYPNGKCIPTIRVFSVRAQRDEEAAAKAAAASADTGAPTIFDKIVSREIPATVVYETEKVLAFRDINPQAPVHVVLVPKQRDGLTQLSKASERNKDVLGELLFAAKVVADQEGLAQGFRVVINDGPDGCQSVYHLHLHLMGGRQLKWPPG